MFRTRTLPFLLLLLFAPFAATAHAQLEGMVVPYRQVELSSPVSSFIVDMDVKEGDAVKAGQPLAQLYGKLEELEMKRTKALLDRREYNAKGAKKLFDNKVIPEAQALESHSDLELARLNYETASEQFRLRTIVSPIDGVVVERRREVGESVSQSQPVFRILDLSKVYILCSLRPEQTSQVTVGQKLTVRIPHLVGVPAFKAEVVHVSPSADASGLFKLRLLVEHPEPGLRVGLKSVVDLPD